MILGIMVSKTVGVYGNSGVRPGKKIFLFSKTLEQGLGVI